MVAIAILAAGLIYAYTHFEGFRNIVNTVASVIGTLPLARSRAFMRALEPIKDHIQNVIAVLTSLVDFVKAVFTGDWGAAWEALEIRCGQRVQRALVSWATLLPSMLFAALGTDLGGLISKVASGYRAIWDGAVSIWELDPHMDRRPLRRRARMDRRYVQYVARQGRRPPQWIAERGRIDVWETIGTWLASIPSKGCRLLWAMSRRHCLQKDSTCYTVSLTDRSRLGEAISIWIASIPGKAVDFIGDVTTTLKQKGIDCHRVRGMARSTSGRHILWFTSLPTMIFNAIADTTETIKSRGFGFAVGILEWRARQVGRGIVLVHQSRHHDRRCHCGDLSSSLWNAVFRS